MPTDFGRVTGDAVNTAARLEAAADPGEILIGDETYRLVRDAVEAETGRAALAQGEGRARPRPPTARGGLGDRAGPPRADLSTMVGRDRELEDLTRAFARAAEDRSCLLFTVLGAAGEGKTRLVEEFLSTVGGSANVVSGRCLPYGEGITYWPVAEAVRGALGVQAFDAPEDVAARLGRRGRRRRARGRDRPSPRRDPGRRRGRRRRRGGAVGDPPVPRDPGGRTPARRALGGHPLGRARVPRRRRSHRGLVARRADHARVHRASGVPRHALGLGRRQVERHDAAAPAARREGVGRADREPARRRRAPARGVGAPHRGGRRATRCSSSRCSR